eukprot:4046687-Amphidinium_carterae.4
MHRFINFFADIGKQASAAGLLEFLVDGGGGKVEVEGKQVRAQRITLLDSLLCVDSGDARRGCRRRKGGDVLKCPCGRCRWWLAA